MDDEDSLLPLQAASVNYRVAVGPDTGKKVFALQTLPAKDEQHYGQLAQINGFSLHAGVFADSHQTDKLERLCRYISRPALSEQRLSLTDSGKVRYQLKTPYQDGTTHVFFTPLDFIGMLAALVVPPENGETEFADMRAAWDELDDDTQKKLEGFSAYHSLYYSQSRDGFNHTTDHSYGLHVKGAPLRPIVKTHPETGRKSIYTGRHAYGIPGMSPQASETLLSDLLDNACQPPRTYKHTWCIGDIAVWDNRCVMHRARPYDTNQPRILRASRISGEPESELAPTFADHRASDFRPSSNNEFSLSS
jgi:alpha-ketoglutarate-dependent taurine dioxygenase